jgi:hypothetical protein
LFAVCEKHSIVLDRIAVIEVNKKSGLVVE